MLLICRGVLRISDGSKRKGVISKKEPDDILITRLFLLYGF